MRLAIVRIHTDLVVTTPTEGSANGASFILTRFTIEGEHNLWCITMGIAGSIRITDHLETTFQRFLRQLGLSTPVTMQMRDPYITPSQRETTRIKTLQDDVALLLMGYLRPRLDDIHFLISLVEDLHRDRHQFILHREDVDIGIGFTFYLIATNR